MYVRHRSGRISGDVHLRSVDQWPAWSLLHDVQLPLRARLRGSRRQLPVGQRRRRISSLLRHAAC